MVGIVEDDLIFLDDLILSWMIEDSNKGTPYILIELYPIGDDFSIEVGNCPHRTLLNLNLDGIVSFFNFRI